MSKTIGPIPPTNRVYLVPFGRYRGQTLDVLKKDTKYIEWIKAQPKLIETYPDFFRRLNQTDSHGQSIPLPTPQHNRVQAQFLSREFASKFFQYLTKIDPEGNRSCWNQISDFFQPDFFAKTGLSISLVRLVGPTTVRLDDRITLELVDWYPQLKLEGTNYADVEFFEPTQIIDGIPKVLLGWFLKITGTYSNEEETAIRSLIQPLLPHNLFIPQVLIEIKPQMGDDYPRILHTMKQRQHNILYLQEFESAVLTLNQMRELFARDGILVVMENELAGKILQKNPLVITPPCRVIRKITLEMEDKFMTVNLYGIPRITYDQIMNWLQNEQKLAITVKPYQPNKRRRTEPSD